MATDIPLPSDLRQNAIDRMRDKPHGPGDNAVERAEFQAHDEAVIRNAFLNYGQPIPAHDEVMKRADGRYCVGLDPALSMIKDPVTLAGLIDGDRARANALASKQNPDIEWFNDVTSSNEPFWSFMPCSPDPPLPMGTRVVEYEKDGKVEVIEMAPLNHMGDPRVVDPEPEPMTPVYLEPVVEKCYAIYGPQGKMVGGAIVPQDSPDDVIIGMQNYAASVAANAPSWSHAKVMGYNTQLVTVVPDNVTSVGEALTVFKQDYLLDDEIVESLEQKAARGGLRPSKKKKNARKKRKSRAKKAIPSSE